MDYGFSYAALQKFREVLRDYRAAEKITLSLAETLLALVDVFHTIRRFFNTLDLQAIRSIVLQGICYQSRIRRMAFDQQQRFLLRLVHTAPRARLSADTLVLSPAVKGDERDKKTG